ncbi:MAG: hypothetical protein ABR953_08790 [Candidatus Acidiferrales bacterium]
MKPKPEQQDPRLTPVELVIRDVTAEPGGGLVFIPAPRDAKIVVVRD